MDWIKKHTDQFALALLALVLVALSALVFLKTQSFAEGFSAAMTSPPHSKEIQKVDTTVIETAQKKFVSPTSWAPKPEVGSLFASWKLVEKDTGLQRAEQGEVVSSDGRRKIPKDWLLKYDLDILSSSVIDDDPDKDGFTNYDEYIGPDLSSADGDKDSTLPKDKNSHAPYYTKLYLKKWIKVPFRLLFNAYDGDPKKDKPETMNFQINTVDLRQPSIFLNLGQLVPKTKFKLLKFEYKTKYNDSIKEDEEASELTLQNTDTQETIVLVYNKVTDSPDSYALFSYLWPDATKPQEIQVKKLQEFVLKPDVQERYKLVDIKEDGAVIQLPGGDKTYNVPSLQKAP